MIREAVGFLYCFLFLFFLRFVASPPQPVGLRNRNAAAFASFEKYPLSRIFQIPIASGPNQKRRLTRLLVKVWSVRACRFGRNCFFAVTSFLFLLCFFVCCILPGAFYVERPVFIRLLFLFVHSWQKLIVVYSWQKKSHLYTR